MFNVGSEYTRDYIHDRLGGSKQSYLPTKSGKVVAACVKLEMNPQAPNVVLCGRGKVIASAAATLARQHESIPIFIKRGINRWEYRGKFKVKTAYASGPQFEALVAASKRNPSDISLAIELS